MAHLSTDLRFLGRKLIYQPGSSLARFSVTWRDPATLQPIPLAGWAARLRVSLAHVVDLAPAALELLSPTNIEIEPGAQVGRLEVFADAVTMAPVAPGNHSYVLEIFQASNAWPLLWGLFIAEPVRIAAPAP